MNMYGLARYLFNRRKEPLRSHKPIGVLHELANLFPVGGLHGEELVADAECRLAHRPDLMGLRGRETELSQSGERPWWHSLVEDALGRTGD